MKNISADMLALLARSDVSPYYLLEIGPNDAAQYFRYVTLPHDFTYQSNLYVAQNGLAGLDPPAISKSTDKESYRVTIVDPLFTLRPFFEGGDGQLIGVPMTVTLGYWNTSDITILGTPAGDEFGEYLIMYQGAVDTANYAVTNENTILRIVGASPMGPLDTSRTILTGRDYIRREYPSETGYDQVFVGSKEIALNWGKAE